MSILKIRDVNGDFQEVLALKGSTGIGLQFVWNGTLLGVKRTIDPDYVYVDLKGNPGTDSDMLQSVYDPTGKETDIFAYDKPYDNTISGIEATTVKTAIDKLSVYSAYHVNMINPDLLLNGYINSITGAFASNSTYRCTDYLPVIEGEVYSCNSQSTTKPCFYDADKVKLEFANTFINITVPANALYMRVSFLNATPANKMLNLGATVLTYVPYVEPEFQLKTGFIRDGIIKDFMTDSTVRAYINQFILEQGGSSGLYGLKWACLGDSLTQGTPKYHTYISERTGCTILNYGAGGRSISYREDVPGSMSEMYTTMDDTADIITVWGGTNDTTIPIGVMSDRVNTTFFGACHVLFAGLIEKYPAKRIGVIIPLRRGETSLTAIVAAEIEVARYYNLPVLDMYYEGGIYSPSATVQAAVIPDGLHPNAAGHLKMSWKIQNFIESL
jgi:lysophospholipase L1-like esterase